jgi:FkbM family methyltransferase
MPPSPVLHVHVSGSAGSTMCHLARQQPSPPNSSVAGNAYGCLLPCKAQGFWKSYSSLEAGKPFLQCQRLYGRDRHGNCSVLAARMAQAQYGVLGMTETVLDESNNEEYAAIHGAFVRDVERRSRRCGRERQSGCCGCNAPSLFEPLADGNRSLVVPRRAPSPFDKWWPLRGFMPLATFCANIKYMLVMHEPLHRMLAQLLLRCPSANRTRDEHGRVGCVGWALHVLTATYAHDLVLDTHDSSFGLSGTPALSNALHRILLGPRVFFARLHGVTRRHHDALRSMLARFALLLPVRALSGAAGLIERTLGWSAVRMRHVHRHVRPADADESETLILEALGPTLRRHNEWDLRAYAFVEAAHETQKETEKKAQKEEVKEAEKEKAAVKEAEKEVEAPNMAGQRAQPSSRSNEPLDMRAPPALPKLEETAALPNLEEMATATQPSFTFAFNPFDRDMLQMRRRRMVEPMLTYAFHQLTHRCCQGDTHAQTARGGGAAGGDGTAGGSGAQRDGKRARAAPRPMVIDVGGNFGYFTLFARALGCDVHVFEPVALYRRVLAENLRRNPSLSGGVTVHAALAYDRPGRFEVRVPNATAALHHGMAGMVGEHGLIKGYDPAKATSEWASATTIDALALPAGVPVCALKVDVEGYEAQALAGAARLLRSGAVRSIVMELTRNKQLDVAAEWRQSRATTSTLDMLASAGFEFRQHVGTARTRDSCHDGCCCCCCCCCCSAVTASLASAQLSRVRAPYGRLPNKLAMANASWPGSVARWTGQDGPWEQLPRFPSVEAERRRAVRTRETPARMSAMEAALTWDLATFSTNLVASLK